MAYSEADRRGARRLFVEVGRTIDQVSAETGIARSTLMRWSGAERWSDQRRLRQELEHDTLAMAQELARAARESRDPQQAFAAQRAIALAGLGGAGTAADTGYPPPTEVATALLDVLSNHLHIGPVVRRHRQEVIRMTMETLRRIDAGSGSA